MDEAPPRTARLVMWLLLTAALLIGVAQLAVLPPFEGFDETAHFSYLQELADAGRPPRYDHDRLSADIARYPGPMPYSGAEPFDQTGRPTYRSYRQAGAAPLAGGPRGYREGSELNWQAQHPPLYYLAMAPVYRLGRGLGWVDALMTLRLASFALGWAGLAIGAVATQRWAERQGGAGPWTGAIMAAWPFLFPQFFPEFARLGNDSLCLLCMGVAWAALLPMLAGRARWTDAVALGVALGAGLLAKAFFVPIGAGVGVLLLLRWYGGERRPAGLGPAVLAGSLALAIGGWWYLQKAAETGSLTGSDEFIKLARAGGGRLIVENFSPGEFARGLAVIVGTFLWAGSWSLARLPEPLLAGPLLLLAVLAFAYLRRARRFGLVGWAPLALAAPMAAGLVYHVFVWMAGTSAVTPGWYLHILAAPLGFAVALGWRRPRLLACLLAVTLAYTGLAWVMQLSLYSGCAAKLGADKHYSFAGAGCLVDLRTLAALGHPGLAAAALAAGLGCALAAGVLAARAYRPGGEKLERRAEPVLQPL